MTPNLPESSPRIWRETNAPRDRTVPFCTTLSHPSAHPIMTNSLTLNNGSRRLTSPTFTPEVALRIQQAAALEGRSVSNFIARAATVAAEQILTAAPPTSE